MKKNTKSWVCIDGNCNGCSYKGVVCNQGRPRPDWLAIEEKNSVYINCKGQGPYMKEGWNRLEEISKLNLS